MADRSVIVLGVSSGALVGAGVLLSVVGLLEERGWADAVTTWAAFGSIATVAAAVVAIWTLVALKQDSADRTRPVLIAELRHAVLTANAEFLVRNVGQSVARNVKVDFDPPLPGPGDVGTGVGTGLMTPFIQRRYSRVIPTFAPGMVLDNYYQAGGGRGVEPVPDDFTVTISYSDSRGREFVDRYELSMSTTRDQSGGYPSSQGGDSDRRVAAAVEAIARGIGRQ